MKKFYSLILFVLVAASAAIAGPITSNAVTGNWNSASTWVGGVVPALGDDVSIASGANITVTAGTSCNSLTFLAAATTSTVSISSGITLSVTGAVTIPRASTMNTLAVGSGILNAGSIAFTSGGSAVRHQLTISTGTVTVSGDVTTDNTGASASIIFSGAGLLKVGGQLMSSGTVGGTLTTVAGSEVEYYGAAQTARVDTYLGNLTLSGSGAKTFATTPTVNGVLSMEGTATVVVTGAGVVTYGASATLQYNTSTSRTVTAEEWITPFVATGGIIIDNTATITIGAAKSIATGSTVNLKNGVLAAGTNLTMSSTSSISRSEGSMTGTLQGAGIYNVTYTGNSKTTGPELSGSGLTNVTVNLTAGQTATLDVNRTPDGNLSVSAGTFNLSSFTINRSAAGGTLTISNGATMKIGGTNTLPSNYSAHSIGATSTIEYAGTAQAVSALNSSQAYGNLTLSGSGAKSFSAARTVNGTLSMQGTATTTGTSPTFGASSTLEYAGSSAQTTGVEFSSASGPLNLTINNGSGVTLSAARTINGVLNLTNGILSSSFVLSLNTAATVSGASDASFVDGQVKKIGVIGAGGFNFPVGKTGVGYMKIGIANVTGATTEFTAQYIRASATTAFGTTGLSGLGIQGVSNCEYWTLGRAITSSSADVTLSWNAHSPCGGSYLSDPLIGIRIVHYNTGSSTWDAHGGGSVSGNAAAGSLTWTGVSTFSPFSLGALNGSQSTLPVMFNDVKAFEKNHGVQIDWSNMTERDLVNYVVERSANGVNFTAISQQLPRGNNNDKESYSAFDAAPFSGVNYYRIKVLEISGKVIYSKVMKVDIGKTAQSFTLYPNPVAGGQVSVSLSAAQGQYSVKVVNTSGQVMYSQKLNHQGGSMTQTIELPSTVKPGVYNMLISGDNYHEAKMFVVQ